jgi:ATP-dependent DNA helicase RecG
MVAGRLPMVMDQTEFWARFGRVEHEALEFKASANNLREVIPAMAMTAGGHVVLGVTENRMLRGCPLTQRVFDAISRRAQEARVEVGIDPLVVGGVPLTLVTVPPVPGRIVTTADGRLLRRVGSDNTPLCHEQLVRFVRRHLGLRPRLFARLALR